MLTWNDIKSSKQYIYLTSLGISFWAFIIISTLIGFISIFYIEDVMKFLISDYGYIGIFFIVLIIELLVQPTGPDLVLIMGLVASLNPWMVLILVLASANLSLYIAYLIGRKIGSSGVQKITGKKSFEKITATTAQGGKWFMLISSFTPLPYIPYFVGIWNFNLKDTILYVVLPRAIRLLIVFFLTYYLGVKLLDISVSNII